MPRFYSKDVVVCYCNIGGKHFATKTMEYSEQK